MNIGLVVRSFEEILQREEIYLLFITQTEITLAQMDFEKKTSLQRRNIGTIYPHISAK